MNVCFYDLLNNSDYTFTGSVFELVNMEADKIQLKKKAKCKHGNEGKAYVSSRFDVSKCVLAEKLRSIWLIFRNNFVVHTWLENRLSLIESEFGCRILRTHLGRPPTCCV